MRPMVGANHLERADKEQQWLPHAIIPQVPHRIREYLWNPEGGHGMTCFWDCVGRALGKSPQMVVGAFVRWRAEKLDLHSPSALEFMEKGISIPLLLHGCEEGEDVSVGDAYDDDGEVDSKAFSEKLKGTRKLVSQVEDCFSININLLYLDEGCIRRLSQAISDKEKQPRKRARDSVLGGVNKTLVLCAAHVSCRKHGSKVKANILLGSSGGKDEEVHCYLMDDAKTSMWVRALRCHFCSRHFTRIDKLKEHTESGTCVSRFRYPGGVYRRRKSLWERLREDGVDYASACRPGDGAVPSVGHYACWDIETRPVPMEPLKFTKSGKEKKVYGLARHEALSAALCTTLHPEEDPVFIYCPNTPRHVFEHMYDKLREWQEEAEQEWHHRMQDVYLQLEEKIARLGGKVITTPERFECHSEEVQGMIVFNATKAVTEQELDRVYSSDMRTNYADLSVWEARQRRTPHPEVDLRNTVGGMDVSRDIFVQPGNLAALDSAFDQKLLDEARSLDMGMPCRAPVTSPHRDCDDSDSDPTHQRYLAQLLEESEWSDVEDEELLMAENEADDDEEPLRKKRCSFIADEADEVDEAEWDEVPSQVAAPGEEVEERVADTPKWGAPVSARCKEVQRLTRLLKQCKVYGALLPAVGYNSSSFDLGVMALDWPRECGFLDRKNRATEKTSSLIPPERWDERKGEMVHDPNTFPYLSTRDEAQTWTTIISNGNTYKQILSAHKVNFIDLINYVPAHTSLDNLVKSYKMAECKGLFPYKALSFDNVNEIVLGCDTASYELFEDVLRKCAHRVVGNILEREWENYTATVFQKVDKPLIDKVACDLALMECREGQSDIRRMKMEWLLELGYFSSDIQKPRTMDLESVAVWGKDGHLEPLTYKVADHLPFQTGVGDFVPLPDRKAKRGQFPPTGPAVYAEQLKLWREKRFLNIIEYLAWYNQQDVKIMIPLIAKMNDNFKRVDDEIEMFRMNVSLPNIARNIGFKEAEREGGVFHLAKGALEGELLERTMRAHMAGGPSIGFERRHLAHMSSVRGHPEEVIRSIQTWDANALYPRCMQNDMPVGNRVIYYGPRPSYDLAPLEEDESEEYVGVEWGAKEIGPKGIHSSLGERLWMKEIEERLRGIGMEERGMYSEGEHTYPTYVEPLTEYFHDRPLRIGQYIVDGVRPACRFTDRDLHALAPSGEAECKGIVYEFLGSYFHGEPVLIELARSKNKRERVERLLKSYLRTYEKMKALVTEGYALIMCWESSFVKGSRREDFWSSVKDNCPTFYKRFLHGHNRKVSKVQNQRQCLRTLADPELFTELIMSGYDKDDVLTDSCDYSQMEFFGMARVDIEPDPENPAFIMERLEKFPPLFVKGRKEGEKHNSLRGVLRAKKTLLSTPYIRCLIGVGMKVTEVYCVYEYACKKVLRSFVDKAVEARKRGDLPGGNPLDANTYKLLINSFYGGSIMNKDKHSETIFTGDKMKACVMQNTPSFVNAREVSREVYEVEHIRSKITQDIPIQMGFFILNYAKVHMVQFYHHILAPHLRKNSFNLMSMDTDSFTFALAARKLTHLVEDKEVWENTIVPNWFLVGPHASNKRTPGPFKEEFAGEACVVLSSKLFTVSGKDQAKIACKGLPKRSLFSDPFSDFDKCLRGSDLTVTYRGIQRSLKDNSMCTNEGKRTVSNKYSKRLVDKDDITHTTCHPDIFDCTTPQKMTQIRYLRSLCTKARKRDH